MISSKMTLQTSCVMTSSGLRGLNTATVSCGVAMTVASGRTYSVGFNVGVSDESEPLSSSSGSVRGHPSGWESTCGEDGEVVATGTFTAGLSKAHDLFDGGGGDTQLGVAKMAS